MIRWAYLILGGIGIPPMMLVLQVNWRVMRNAKRKAERYIAVGFFIYSVALAVLLVGHSTLALWQLTNGQAMNLWPAVIQIGWLFVADVGLIGMCGFSMFLDRDRRRQRGN